MNGWNRNSLEIYREVKSLEITQKDVEITHLIEEMFQKISPRTWPLIALRRQWT